MPRSPRLEIAGGVHHVYSRGAVRQDVYRDDADRRLYLATLSRVSRRMGWRCLTYCLMSNHMHLLIETPQPNLGRGMHRLHGSYAQAFNRRHKGSGHVFQGRFEAVPVNSDAQLWTVVSYIVLNPVAAGLCAAPGAWPWSSHTAVSEGSAPPWLDAARLLDHFRSHGGDPRRRYLEFVEAVDEHLHKGARPL